MARVDIEEPMAADDTNEVAVTAGRISLRDAEENTRVRMRLGLSRMLYVYRHSTTTGLTSGFSTVFSHPHPPRTLVPVTTPTIAMFTKYSRMHYKVVY